MVSASIDKYVNSLDRFPVLGICGSSGAGKTTLVESLIPRLQSIGLQVAVVKPDARNVCIDVAGKDSDRIFCAGADVSLFGDECFTRLHDCGDFVSFLTNLCISYDLVLVEGHARTAIPKIWLLGQEHAVPHEYKGRILEVFTREEADSERVFHYIQQWLSHKFRQVPVWGCVLIGGKSRRMGRPKHLIQHDGKSWLEHAVNKLRPLVDQVVLSGPGHVPDSLKTLPRISDAPDLAGPMAGILAVMRWQPAASWLVMACDLPYATVESLEWLLDSRVPGVRAILPDLQGDGRVEPLLAWYDYRCRLSLEEIAASGSLRISQLVGQPGIHHFQPPEHLRSSWRNVNTERELEEFGVRYPEEST